MQNLWGGFVYNLSENKRKDVSEDVYHELVETQLQLLGWYKYLGEIHHKRNFSSGHGWIQPDIIIGKENDWQFVIEVKRPCHHQTRQDLEQLESYMRRIKVSVGIYIGEHIEVFYDKSDAIGSIQSVLKVSLDVKDENGATFVRLFSKDHFDKEKVEEFCEKCLVELERQTKLKGIKAEIIADADGWLSVSLAKFLSERYKGTFEEEEVKAMVSEICFTATDRDTVAECAVNNEAKKVEYKSQIRRRERKCLVDNEVKEEELPCKGEKRSMDNTQYSLDNGAYMGKGRFVLHLVATYVKQHPEATFADLEHVFRPEYQGSCGVIRSVEWIEKKGFKGHRRYFDRENELLHSADNIVFAVTTQWNKENVKKIEALAKQLGYEIRKKRKGGRGTKAASEGMACSPKDSLVECRIARGSDAKGVFNVEDHSLVVLKGSRINPRELSSLTKSFAAHRERLMAEHTYVDNGERIVRDDILFSAPSAASRFCTGGSSNGWMEWKDLDGNPLDKYRSHEK